MAGYTANDPNNPLLSLLAGRPMTGSTGFNVSGLFSGLQSGWQNGIYGNEESDGAGSYGITPEQMAILRSLGLTTDTQMESPVTSFNGQTLKSNGNTYQVDPVGDININGQNLAQLNSLNVGGPNGVIDPSKVTYDPRFGLVTPPSNLNNLFTTGYGNGLFAAAALGFGLPTAAAALGGGAAGGVASTDAAESGGTLGLNAAGTGVAPYVPTSGVGVANYAPVTQGGDSVPGVGGTQSAAPISDGSTPIPGTGAAPITNGATPIPGTNPGGSFLGNLSSGNFNGALSSAGNWAMSHPVQALGLLQTGVGLVQNHGSSSPSAGGKSSGGSGVGGSLNIPPVNYTPNPYLMAQLQRGY